MESAILRFDPPNHDIVPIVAARIVIPTDPIPAAGSTPPAIPMYSSKCFNTCQLGGNPSFCFRSVFGTVYI
jgi:hypothetical protein